MQVRLDPWPIDTKDGQLSLTPFEGLVFDVETTQWKAIMPQPIPQRLREVVVIDGKPRMEARLLVDQDGRLSLAGFGAYVVGAVSLCPHGTRQAALHDVQVRRVLAYQEGSELAMARLSPRNPHTGMLEYTPVIFRGTQVEGAAQQIQKMMLLEEQKLGAHLASELPVEREEEDSFALPETLVFQDGRLDLGNQTRNRAIVGYVKTLHTDYLGTDRIGLLSTLKTGERTPILRFSWGGGDSQKGSGHGNQQRFTWYVRLSDAPFYQHPMAGVMRLEMYAPDDCDFVPQAVQDIADLSGTLMYKLGSTLHKDKRAPQNLIPTVALEQAMNRAMGNIDLVTRRIRKHLASELVTGAQNSSQ